MSIISALCPTKHTSISSSLFFFFFNDTATTEIYTLSLHDALPISPYTPPGRRTDGPSPSSTVERRDRKSTRLNSSHLGISYAVFCLKKKTKSHMVTSSSVALCVRLRRSHNSLGT